MKMMINGWMNPLRITPKTSAGLILSKLIKWKWTLQDLTGLTELSDWKPHSAPASFLISDNLGVQLLCLS